MADIYVATTGNDSTGDGSSGNPYASPGKAAGVMAGGDRMLVKAGTYTSTTNTSNVAGGYPTPPAGSAGAPTRIVGYSSTVGDLDDVSDFSGFPTIKGSASTYCINAANTDTWIQNLILDGDAHTSYCLLVASTYSVIYNVKAINSAVYDFALSGSRSRAVRCFASGGNTGFNCDGFANEIVGCASTGATSAGFFNSSYTNSFIRCIAYAGSGGSADGFRAGSEPPALINCVSRGNGRDGLRFADAPSVRGALVMNCIFAGNGGYGINSVTTNWTIVAPAMDWNFFHSNTSGPRNQLTAGPHDVTLTGDPFTAAGSGDFSLNNTAGAGAAVRAAGWPGVFPGGLTTGYPDGGAAQHQDSGGGGSVGGVPAPIVAGTFSFYG